MQNVIRVRVTKQFCWTKTEGACITRILKIILNYTEASAASFSISSKPWENFGRYAKILVAHLGKDLICLIQNFGRTAITAELQYSGPSQNETE